MGFISSGTSTTDIKLDIHLTNYGRGLVITGNVYSEISKFGLCDIDTDYRQPQTDHTLPAPSQAGIIPDVTGKHSTCPPGSINDGYKQSSFVWHEPSDEPPTIDKRVLIGINDHDTGIMNYYNDVEVEIYLHDYFALCKLIANLYAEDHVLLYQSPPATHVISDFTNAFLASFQASGGLNETQVFNAFQTLSNMGRGQYLDFWDEVALDDYGNGTLTYGNIALMGDSQSYHDNLVAFMTGLVRYNEDCSMSAPPHLQTESHEVLAKNRGPYTIAFSSRKFGQSYAEGAGRAGLAFATEFGYITSNMQSDFDNVSYYPIFGVGSSQSIPGGYSQQDAYTNLIQSNSITCWGFVSPVIFEAGLTDGQYGNPTFMDGDQNTYDVLNWNTGNNDFMGPITTVVPTLVYYLTRQPETDGYYYPIKSSRNSNYDRIGGTMINPGNKVFSTIGGEVNQITWSTHPTDTFALLGSSLEYFSLKNANTVPWGSQFSPSPQGNTAQQVQNGGIYYNYFTRCMKSSDHQLISIYNDYGGQSFPTTYDSFSAASSASADYVDDFNITIPINMTVYSKDYPADYIPAQCRLKIIFNKGAALESVAFSSDTSGGNIKHYRLWDKDGARFYGEYGATKAGYTINPTDTSTNVGSTGGKIFRKVTGTPIYP